MPAEEWTTAEDVHRYLGQADEYPRRAEGRASGEIFSLLEPGGCSRTSSMWRPPTRRLHLAFFGNPCKSRDGEGGIRDDSPHSGEEWVTRSRVESPGDESAPGA